MKRGPLIVLALALAYAGKRYYSHADADSLRWMLAPTAWLVGAAFRAPFSFVPGYGYLSRELSFGIVPACAGINFLLIAVGAFVCGILPQVPTWRRRLAWLTGGALAAYAVTLVANATRISIAVWLQLHPIDVDHAQLHRIEGSVVYLIFLYGFYSLAQSRAQRDAR